MEQEIKRIDLNGVNSYLLKQGGSFILVDTGGHLNMDADFNNRRGMLKMQLDHAGCTPENLKLILLTHGDSDHVTNVSYLKEEYGVRAAMHADDLALVEHPTLEKVMENFHFSSPVYKLIGVFISSTVKKITQKVLDDFEPFKPDIFVDDGSGLLEYGFDARIIHIPGHTQGRSESLRQTAT